MTAGSRVAWLWLLCLSCGSRSALLGADDGNASGGAAGSGAHTASGGSGGSGATGGASGGAGGTTGGTAGVAGSGAAGRAACNALELTPPIMNIEQPGPMLHEDENPLATWSSPAGEQVTIAFLRKPWEAPSSAGALHLTTLAPWGPWPATPNGVLSSAALMPGQASPSMALDRGAAVGISLAFPIGVTAVFAPEIDPDQPVPIAMTSLSGRVPAFVSRADGGRFLVGTYTPLVTELIVSEVDVTSGSAAVVAENVVACGQMHLPSDAVPFEDGWLVAAWNHEPSCAGAPSPSPILALDVKRVRSGGTVEFVTTLSTLAQIQDVRLAPHTQGAWFVYRTAAGGDPPLRIGKLSVSDAAVIDLPDVNQSGEAPSGFDFHLMGDRPVVAWVNELSGTEDALMISMRDADGLPLSVTSLERSLHGAPAIVPAPDGRGVLVAWEAWPSRRIEVARFDCVP